MAGLVPGFALRHHVLRLLIAAIAVEFITQGLAAIFLGWY
jgi:small neutral amino acid transporter SnatA (MarC family)